MAKGRTTAGIKTELSAQESYSGEINLYRVNTGAVSTAGYFDQRVSSSQHPPMPYGWEADDSTQTWILQRLQTYQFYVYEEHCEFVRKLQHGLTVTELDKSGHGDRRILALWPPGRAVPDRDEHSKRFWKNQSRGLVTSTECLYPKLSLGQKVRNKLVHGAEHGTRSSLSHLDELDEPYLDLKWQLDDNSILSKESALSWDRSQLQNPNSGYSEQRCVLLFNRPVPDEPDYVHIETIREALLGIR